MSFKRFLSMVKVLLIITTVSITGCFQENVTTGENYKVNKSSEGTTIVVNKEIAGAEIVVDGDRLENSVSIPSNLLKIVNTADGKTTFSIAGKIEKGTKLLYSGSNINVLKVNTVDLKSAEANYNITKRAGEVLLGDFDNTGSVDLNDFLVFAQAYGGTYNAKYDVAPSTKGTGDWLSIYCFATPDSKVGIDDFIIFAQNYGKKAPVITKTVVSVKVTADAASVEIGKTIQCTATVTYSDNTTEIGNVNWSSTDIAKATVSASGTVTGVIEGSAIIKAEKSGVTGQVTINVTKPAETGITIYMEKPDAWASVYIWYDADATTPAWDTVGDPPSTVANSKMENYRNGWFRKVIGPSTGVEFLFNDGTWANKLSLDGFNKPATAGNFKTTKSIWIKKDGTTFTIDPAGPQPASVNADPAGGSFDTATKVVTLYAAGEGVTGGKYTLDGTDPKNGTPFVNGATITIGADMAVNSSKSLKIYAVNTLGEASKEFIFKKVTKITDLTVYLEKPDTWAGTFIHYWNTLPNAKATVWTAGASMTFVRDKWYKYTFTGEYQASFMFKDAAADTGNKSMEVGDRNKEAWVYVKDGKWAVADRDPYGPQPPVISTNPPGAYFKDTIAVTMNVTFDARTTSLGAKYTVDGSDPKTNGKDFTNGTALTIGGDMALKDCKKVKIWASSKVTATGEIFESTYEGAFTKDDPPVVNRLGAQYTPTATTFSIWSPDSSNVKVTVNGIDYNCIKVADFNSYTDIYSVVVNGDLKLKEYQFKVNNVAVRDPYGLMVKPGTNINIVIEPAIITPEGGAWSARPVFSEREDAVVYEIHVRDFTIDAKSGVDAAKRGKFLGMVQTGTLNGTGKTGIDHLKELGVTHVQLLPFYDFGSAMYNWGYDPVNFNVPEDIYSMTPTDYENRVKEVKTMVNEFHKNGIRVIMDVVYNHTQSNEMFSGITQKYYDGRDLSGCGNAVNSGVPMVSRFIRDSLEYWVNEYNIDGFRFDLIGIFHTDEVKKWGEYINQKYADRNILMYGEPWNGMAADDENVKVRLGNVPAMASGHVGVFNGKYRESIKGGNDDKVMSYIFNQESVDGTYTTQAIVAGIRGSIMAVKSTNTLPNKWDRMFAYDPEQSINYISAHDNLCLWDKIKYCGFDNAYGQRVLKFGMATVLASQGIPFIHGGDEILRTKVYNNDWTKAHNSYNASDDYNMMRWDWKNTNAGTFAYMSNFIKMRRAHPGFRMNTWEEVNDNVKCETIGKAVIAKINGAANGDTWKNIIVIVNPDANLTYTLPSGSWKIAVEKENANVGGTVVSGSVVAEGTSVTVLYQE